MTNDKMKNMKGNDKMTKNVYEIITAKIIQLLEQGTVPWHKPWVGGDVGMHKSLVSNKPYRGINVWLLNCQGYNSPYWLTYNQSVVV